VVKCGVVKYGDTCWAGRGGGGQSVADFSARRGGAGRSGRWRCRSSACCGTTTCGTSTRRLTRSPRALSPSFRPLFALFSLFFALFSPSFRPFSLFSLALIWALGRGARPARSRPLPARRASPSRARVRPRDPREGDSHEAGFGALVYPRARAARQVSLSEFLFTTMHDLWRVEAPIAELS
jgi:hypothetical protein